MYTYERLCQLIRNDNNESEIAHYLLNHLDSLERLTVSKVVHDTGISKASLHRFYNKGGYVNFKDMVLTLNDEIKQKKLYHMNYEKYKESISSCIEKVYFDDLQIKQLMSDLNKAKKVVFYGNTSEIMSLQSLQFYLFMNHIDVLFLDRWDLKSCYTILESLCLEDVFIMVESSWHIQLIYENSIVNTHLLNLDRINALPFKKYYIGQADCDQYLTFYNIKVPYANDHLQNVSLDLLDKKIKVML